MKEGEHPLSGEIEEDSIKPESNRAVQTTFRLQNYKNEMDDPKKLRKYVSLKSPKNSKEDQVLKSMTMKSSQFVLNEIQERKEQDISLDDGQNDGMKSPQVESNSIAPDEQNVNGKKSEFSKNPPLHTKTPSFFQKQKENLNFDENFDSFQTKNDQKVLPESINKEAEASDEF